MLSLTLGIIILAMSMARSPFEIAEVFLGVIVGTFILDSEYILYSYIFEPNTDFAKSIFAYIKSKDFGGVIGFINEHKDEVKEKSLNSVLFQVVLIFVVVFVSYTRTSYFIKAFVLSIFANSIYKLIECFLDGDTKDWFWAIKGTPKRESVLLLIIALVAVLGLALYFV